MSPAQIQSITMNDHTKLPEEVQSLLKEFPKLTRPRTEPPLVPNMKVTHVTDTGDSVPVTANSLKSQNGTLFSHVWRRGRLALDPL